MLTLLPVQSKELEENVDRWRATRRCKKKKSASHGGGSCTHMARGDAGGRREKRGVRVGVKETMSVSITRSSLSESQPQCGHRTHVFFFTTNILHQVDPVTDVRVACQACLQRWRGSNIHPPPGNNRLSFGLTPCTPHPLKLSFLCKSASTPHSRFYAYKLMCSVLVC